MPFPKLSDYLQITPNELVFSKSKNFTCIVKLKKLVESEMWFHHFPHDGFHAIYENDGRILSEEMQVLLAFSPNPLQENFPSTMKIGVVSIDCYSFPIELPVKFSEEMEALDCDICKKVYKTHVPKFVCKNETCTTERNEVCCSCLLETHGLHHYETLLNNLENKKETIRDVLSMLTSKEQDIQQKLKPDGTTIGDYKKEMKKDLKLIKFLKDVANLALKSKWFFLLAEQLSIHATKLSLKEYGNGSSTPTSTSQLPSDNELGSSDLIDLNDTTSLNVPQSGASDNQQTDTLVSSQTLQSNSAPVNEANQSKLGALIAKLNNSKQPIIGIKIPTMREKLTPEVHDDQFNCSTENVVEHDELSGDLHKIREDSNTNDYQQNRFSFTSFSEALQNFQFENNDSNLRDIVPECQTHYGTHRPN